MFDSKCPDGESVVPDAVFPPYPPFAAAFAVYPPVANTIEYEAIPKLLFVDMQQEDKDKVAAAVTNLASLLDTSNNVNWKVNADQARSLGAIAIILLLMRKWPSSRSIHSSGCCVLTWLVHSNDATTTASGAAAAVSIIKSGGIETIVAAMKSFPDDLNIHAKGLNTIGYLFYYTNPAIDKAMAHFVHKLNGIELVVPVMKKFQNNALVQNYGCCILLHLSRKQVLRDALKKGGALCAVGKAIEKHNHKCHCNLQSTATAFFNNILAKS